MVRLNYNYTNPEELQEALNFFFLLIAVPLVPGQDVTKADVTKASFFCEKGKTLLTNCIKSQLHFPSHRRKKQIIYKKEFIRQLAL